MKASSDEEKGQKTVKKNQATMRQIHAVREELDRKINKASEDWEMKNPRPSWELEAQWERKHRSPVTRHQDKAKMLTKLLETKRDALLFDARMGTITAEELYAKAKAF